MSNIANNPDIGDMFYGEIDGENKFIKFSYKDFELPAKDLEFAKVEESIKIIDETDLVPTFIRGKTDTIYLAVPFDSLKSSQLYLMLTNDERIFLNIPK